MSVGPDRDGALLWEEKLGLLPWPSRREREAFQVVGHDLQASTPEMRGQLTLLSEVYWNFWKTCWRIPANKYTGREQKETNEKYPPRRFPASIKKKTGPVVGFLLSPLYVLFHLIGKCCSNPQE